MRKDYYSIKIKNGDVPKVKINKVLGVKSLNKSSIWKFQIIEHKNTPPVFFIKKAYEILKDKFEVLEKELGIEKGQITIWQIIQYRGECNFEMSPEDAKLISEMGVTFCLSCYEV